MFHAVHPRVSNVLKRPPFFGPRANYICKSCISMGNLIMSPEPFLVVEESKSHSDVTLPDKFLSVLLSDLIGLLGNFSLLVENVKEQEADWCRLIQLIGQRRRKIFPKDEGK